MKAIPLLFCLCFFLFTSSICSARMKPNFSEEEALVKLQLIHAELDLLDGTLDDEFPEQMMSVMFISKNDKVLEIGGNIGRNSCVISSLLKDSKNLVVSESDPIIAKSLVANRDRNNFFFHVEDSAISQIPLIQAGWVTVPQKNTLLGYTPVKTITYKNLKKKYQIKFNVLVSDCEGALYYILEDDEKVLEDVKMIIVENDYSLREHYEEVCAKFISHNFHLVYNKAGGFGPCYNEFYQVWKKL